MLRQSWYWTKALVFSCHPGHHAASGRQDLRSQLSVNTISIVGMAMVWIMDASTIICHLFRFLQFNPVFNISSSNWGGCHHHLISGGRIIGLEMVCNVRIRNKDMVLHGFNRWFDGYAKECLQLSYINFTEPVWNQKLCYHFSGWQDDVVNIRFVQVIQSFS